MLPLRCRSWEWILRSRCFRSPIADANWRVVEQQRLTRTQMERWFANRAVGLVVMEACGSAHHWARWLNGLGIEVKLLPAAYVRAYVKRNKTDAADACALLEAARCADIVPVRVKSVEQQAVQALHRTRSLWMATRTSRINALRGFCREFGIAIAQGARLGVEQIGRVLADPHSAVPELIRPTMTLLVEEIRLLEARISQLERELTLVARQSPGVHDPAVDSRGGLAHRHRDGGRHQRSGRSLRRCASLRRLVRPDAQGAFLRGQHAPPGTHLQTRRSLSAHAPHPRRSLRSCARPASAAASRPQRRCAASMGARRSSSEPITTRRPARWPTSSRASATRVCATARPTGEARRLEKKIARVPSRSPPEHERFALAEDFITPPLA